MDPGAPPARRGAVGALAGVLRGGPRPPALRLRLPGVLRAGQPAVGGLRGDAEHVRQQRQCPHRRVPGQRRRVRPPDARRRRLPDETRLVHPLRRSRRFADQLPLHPGRRRRADRRGSRAGGRAAGRGAAGRPAPHRARRKTARRPAPVRRRHGRRGERDDPPAGREPGTRGARSRVVRARPARRSAGPISRPGVLRQRAGDDERRAGRSGAPRSRRPVRPRAAGDPGRRGVLHGAGHGGAADGGGAARGAARRLGGRRLARSADVTAGRFGTDDHPHHRRRRHAAPAGRLRRGAAPRHRTSRGDARRAGGKLHADVPDRAHHGDRLFDTQFLGLAALPRPGQFHHARRRGGLSSPRSRCCRHWR
ncbi:MAG: hypothetical protein KatS3mg121_0169 [Gammaproteobacteria bacterium]|nr:MAG: hypothetical protein KatS3mg121_0169 [Gammaproteobacteria bacterium]